MTREIVVTIRGGKALLTTGHGRRTTVGPAPKGEGLFARWLEEARLLDRPTGDVKRAIVLFEPMVTLLDHEATQADKEAAANALAEKLPARLGDPVSSRSWKRQAATFAAAFG